MTLKLLLRSQLLVGSPPLVALIALHPLINLVLLSLVVYGLLATGLRNLLPEHLLNCVVVGSLTLLVFGVLLQVLLELLNLFGISNFG